MIREKGVAQLILLHETIRLRECGIDEGDSRPGQLPEIGFQKGIQLRAVLDFALLPGRLQSAGMGKAARGKSRVRQLPQQPVAWSTAELRC